MSRTIETRGSTSPAAAPAEAAGVPLYQSAQALEQFAAGVGRKIVVVP